MRGVLLCLAFWSDNPFAEWQLLASKLYAVLWAKNDLYRVVSYLRKYDGKAFMVLEVDEPGEVNGPVVHDLDLLLLVWHNEGRRGAAVLL